MIQTKITKDAKGYQGIELSGHAASGEYGFDVMCASVSVLSFNFVNSVAELTKIEPILKIVEDGGFLIVERPDLTTENQHQVWEILFSSLVIGLENLSENASQYIAKPVIKHVFNGGNNND